MAYQIQLTETGSIKALLADNPEIAKLVGSAGLGEDTYPSSVTLIVEPGGPRPVYAGIDMPPGDRAAAQWDARGFVVLPRGDASTAYKGRFIRDCTLAIPLNYGSCGNNDQ